MEILQRAFWRAALLTAPVALAACSTALVQQNASSIQPTQSGGQRVQSIVQQSPVDGVEISEPRWLLSTKDGVGLPAFTSKIGPPAYIRFCSSTASGILDARYAVQTDACRTQNYSPFDLKTGT